MCAIILIATPVLSAYNLLAAERLESSQRPLNSTKAKRIFAVRATPPHSSTMASTFYSDALVGLPGILSSRAATSVAVFAGFVALCRGLRYRRRNSEEARRPYKTREDFKKMTAEEAWDIVRYVQSCEFPWISKKALSFALFKYVQVSSKGAFG